MIIAKLEWTEKNCKPFAEWEQDGLTLRATFELDDCPDFSRLGEFSNEEKEGAIRHSDDPRYCTYFNPTDYDPANPEYAQEDYERMLDHERGDWCYGGIVVQVVRPLENLKHNGYEKIRDDIVLASSALWGIESDSGEDYFTECALDLASEAIDEARQTLSELCN